MNRSRNVKTLFMVLNGAGHNMAMRYIPFGVSAQIVTWSYLQVNLKN